MNVKLPKMSQKFNSEESIRLFEDLPKLLHFTEDILSDEEKCKIKDGSSSVSYYMKWKVDCYEIKIDISFFSCYCYAPELVFNKVRNIFDESRIRIEKERLDVETERIVIRWK